MIKIVLDTNVLLVSISKKSKYHWLYKILIEQKISIAFSNEILRKYDEVISFNWHPEVAKNVIRSLLELPSAHFSIVYFNLNLMATKYKFSNLKLSLKSTGNPLSNN